MNDEQELRERFRVAILDAPNLIGHHFGSGDDRGFALHDESEIAEIATDAVMAVVLPLLAARDAAVEAVERGDKLIASLRNLILAILDAAPADEAILGRKERAEAERDLAIGNRNWTAAEANIMRRQLDQVREWASLGDYGTRDELLAILDGTPPNKPENRGIRAYIEGDDDLRRKFGGV